MADDPFKSPTEGSEKKVNGGGSAKPIDENTPPNPEDMEENGPTAEFEESIKGLKNFHQGANRSQSTPDGPEIGDEIKIGGNLEGSINLAGRDVINNSFYVSFAKEFQRNREEEFQRKKEQRTQAAAAAKETGNFAIWLAGLEEPELYYYIFTAALFEGIDWGVFIDIHSQMLKDVGITDNEDEMRYIDTYTFVATDEELTNQTCVEKCQKTYPGEFGEITSHFVQFQRNDWKEQVLDGARKKYSNQLMKFQSVIRFYGKNSKLKIRMTSAEAAAELAVLDFNQVWQNIIQIWAMDRKSDVRNSVAYFVDALLWKNMLVGNVLRALHNWADDTHWQLRASAATAYGQVSQYRLDLAFKELTTLATDSEASVAQAVAESMVSIFQEDNGKEVISTLREWAKMPERKQDRKEDDIERNAIAVWILIVLGFIDFESDKNTSVQNLFTMIAEDPTGPLTEDVVKILVPHKREPLGLVFEVIRTWSKSPVPYAEEALASLILMSYHNVDNSKKKLVVNKVKLWEKSSQTDVLKKAASRASYGLPDLLNSGGN